MKSEKQDVAGKTGRGVRETKRRRIEEQTKRRAVKRNAGKQNQTSFSIALRVQTESVISLWTLQIECRMIRAAAMISEKMPKKRGGKKKKTFELSSLSLRLHCTAVREEELLVLDEKNSRSQQLVNSGPLGPSISSKITPFHGFLRRCTIISTYLSLPCPSCSRFPFFTFQACYFLRF